MEAKKVEEKYDLARMGLMLIERITMAVRIGDVPREDVFDVILQIGNMCHVINHENEEQTFDCGPNRDQHHAAALQEYRLMEQAMYDDIRHGVDYSQRLGGGRRRCADNEVDFNEVEPLKF